MCQDFIPIQGVLYLFGIKKSNMLSHSFQTNHHPITITISCLSMETTTTTTTITVNVSITVTLCRCRLAPQLLLELMFQVIADNRQEMLRQRPHNTNRTGRWPPVSIELFFGPAPSAMPPQPTLPLATNITPPLPEPTTAPNPAGHLPAILAIFAAAQLLLFLRWTR